MGAMFTINIRLNFQMATFLTDLHDFLVFKHVKKLRAKSFGYLFEYQQVFDILSRNIDINVREMYCRYIFFACTIPYEPNKWLFFSEKQECKLAITYH